MPELEPRRKPAPVPAPSAAELQAAQGLLADLQKLAPDALKPADPEISLPALAHALQSRGCTSEY